MPALASMGPDRDGAMTESDWSGLMAAAQAGDGSAYRRLLEDVRVWLCRYYARRLPTSMIDDAAQETLIAIHQKRHTYDPRRPFTPWLAGIARYKWIDRLRDLKRNACEALPENVGVGDHGSSVISATVLETLLAQLKPAQSAAIRLVKIHGLSVEETAARTGQSQSLVKVNIHRGLARLATIVQQQDPIQV